MVVAPQHSMTQQQTFQHSQHAAPPTVSVTQYDARGMGVAAVASNGHEPIWTSAPGMRGARQGCLMTRHWWRVGARQVLSVRAIRVLYVPFLVLTQGRWKRGRTDRSSKLRRRRTRRKSCVPTPCPGGSQQALYVCFNVGSFGGILSWRYGMVWLTVHCFHSAVRK
jgi:hypothetical protein